MDFNPSNKRGSPLDGSEIPLQGKGFLFKNEVSAVSSEAGCTFRKYPGTRESLTAEIQAYLLCGGMAGVPELVRFHEGNDKIRGFVTTKEICGATLKEHSKQYQTMFGYQFGKRRMQCESILYQALKVMMNLHRRGVYHNDFAMENIMIGFLKQGQMSYGEGDVVVLDFGASRAAERAKRERENYRWQPGDEWVAAPTEGRSEYTDTLQDIFKYLSYMGGDGKLNGILSDRYQWGMVATFLLGLSHPMQRSPLMSDDLQELVKMVTTTDPRSRLAPEADLESFPWMKRMARAAEDPNPVIYMMPREEVDALPKCWGKDAQAKIGRVYDAIGATNGMEFVVRAAEKIENASAAGEVAAREDKAATASRASAAGAAAVAVASLQSERAAEEPMSANPEDGKEGEDEDEDGAGASEKVDGQRSLDSAGKVLAEKQQQQRSGGVDERSRGGGGDGDGGDNSSGAVSGTGSSGGGSRSGSGDKRARSVEEEEDSAAKKPDIKKRCGGRQGRSAVGSAIAEGAGSDVGSKRGRSDDDGPATSDTRTGSKKKARKARSSNSTGVWTGRLRNRGGGGGGGGGGGSQGSTAARNTLSPPC